MFIRSKTRPFGRQMSTSTVRTLQVLLYTLYPLGCILQLLSEGSGSGVLTSISGLLLVVASLIIFAVLAGSGLQRQTQEPEELLDERNRASFQAHSVFSAIVLAGVLYMMLTTDMAETGKLDLWRPTAGEHWNAVLGGLILLSFTLPGAILAFGKSRAEAD